MLKHSEKTIDYIVVEDVDPKDYPNFSDAYACEIAYTDGTMASDEELEDFNTDSDNADMIHMAALEHYI